MRTGRPVGESAGRGADRERAADAPAVEVRRPRPVEPPVVALAALPEAERRRPFHEKRPLLGEVGLGVAQVHDGRIHLDLAEVRIDRRVEGEVRAETDLGVGAEAGGEARAVVERIARAVWRKLGAAGDVRQQLDAPRRGDLLDADEVDKARHEAAAVLGRVDDVVDLVLAGDFAAEVDAPDVLALPQKPQLRVGDPHLGGPPRRVASDLRLPHPVPAVVVPVVVVERAVVQRPRRVDAEVEPAAAVVIRVDVHGEAVGVGAGIAPAQPRHDRIGMVVVEPRAHVQRRVVVGDVHGRALARRQPLVRVALAESGDPHRRAPDGVGQHSVDHDRGRGAHGAHLLDERRRGGSIRFGARRPGGHGDLGRQQE